MRNTKLWSVLLAAVLLCGCVLGVLFTGAFAADTAVTYTVNTANTENDETSLSFKSIAEALAFAAEQDWKTNEKLVIEFTGTETGNVENSDLMFGQKTIWRRVDADNAETTVYGNKLPIEIAGQTASDADLISVTANVACANDYTFKNLTLDNWTGDYSVFAGSGNILLESLAAKTSVKGRVYGDNFTAEAFDGWTKSDFEALKDEDGCILTSASFKDYAYAGNISNGSSTFDSFSAIAAVGAEYNTAEGKDAYTATASDDTNYTITPADTKAKVHVISGNVTSRISAYVAENPARVHTAFVRVTGGSAGCISGDEGGGTIANNIVNGNIDIYVENATFTSTGVGIRVFYGDKSRQPMTVTNDAPAGEYGNVTVFAKNVKQCACVFIAGDNNTAIPGKAIITIDNVDHNGQTDVTKKSNFEYLGIIAKSGVENTIKNCYLTSFSGTRLTDLANVKVDYITNTLENIYFKDTTKSQNTGKTINYVGNAFLYNGTGMRTSQSVKITADNITNNLTECVFDHKRTATTISTGKVETTYPQVRATYGAVVSGKVQNNLTDCQFKQNEFVGAYSTTGLATTINEIENNFVGGTYSKTFNCTYNTKFNSVKNTFKSGTFNGAIYGCYAAGGAMALGDVYNYIQGGTFAARNYIFGGYGATSIKSVTNEVTGSPVFEYTGTSTVNGYDGVCFGAGSRLWPSKVLGNVTTTIKGGTFKHQVIAGGTTGYVVGDIINNVEAGSFGKFYAAGYGGCSTTDSAKTYLSEDFGKLCGGAVKNTFGKAGAETGPSFSSFVFGGDMGSDKHATVAYDIVNTVNCATFDGNFYGGADSSRSSVKSITNIINGGTFAKRYHGGSYSAATGSVKNVINGGQFNGASNVEYMTAYLGGYNAEITGGIVNEINGGEFAAYLIAGTNGATISNSTAGAPAISNTVTGGVFHNFWGGNSKNNNITGDIVNNISGGTFDSLNDGKQVYPNCFSGGNRNGAHAGGNITNNISGGVFKWHFTAGNNAHTKGYGLAETAPANTVTTNITGGIFEGDVYANYRPGTVDENDFRFETAILNITPTEGKELAFYATANDITSFDASSDVVVTIGKNAFLGIDSLTGTLKVEQDQKWQARIYVTVATANADIQYATAEGVLGSASVIKSEATTDLVGNGIEISSASLLISDRIQLKLMLDADEIAALPADFEFTFVTEDGTVLATVNAENIGKALDGYYNVILSALGLSEFDKTIVCEGNYLYRMEMTVISLADLGAKYYTETAPNETYAQLFRSIADLGRKANGEETVYELVTKAVNWTASKAPQALDSRLSMKTKGLVMTDAIGIRLTGETVAVDTPLTFVVNGKDVTEYCIVTRSETADETSGKFGFTVDMYVNVAMMTKELDIQICDDAETALFTMTLRVDALAEQIAAATEVDGELSDYALAFIQAADAYVEAKEA